MKRSWFPFVSVFCLLILLGVLAALQYRWLGQISQGERERLQKNLQNDTDRFKDDFNGEIQAAYFNFQLSADVWQERKWNEFNARYDYYQSKTKYPDLIKDFYFIEASDFPQLLKYQKENRGFSPVQWNSQFEHIWQRLLGEPNFQPVNEELNALLMPVYDTSVRMGNITIQTKSLTLSSSSLSPPLPPSPFQIPRKYGVLVIELNDGVIKNQLFPDLVKKYFSESESAYYKLSITDKNNRAIFQTSDVTAPDVTAKLFSLIPDTFIPFAYRNVLSAPGDNQNRNMVFSRIESNKIQNPGGDKSIVIETHTNSPQAAAAPSPVINGQKIRIFESQNGSGENGVWTLNVQHESGSLEKFITETRYKNLAVSFGILSLLAVSVMMIFLSAQRAKMLAQRQVDFVSSVSHEFRTPLSVIYSASENLADGVARESAQVSRYGNLIKGEGKKLSAMVEQILEFAGARSGKRKYDFRGTNVSKIIEQAIAECQPIIAEKHFTVEKEIAENLPNITVDEKAMTQAVQNLIANSLKYSDNSKWLKVSVRNGGNTIKITVEDRGIGINKSELKKVFEPFYRSKQVVDEQIHGNGLGLSLVKQIVDAHGGKIKVESELEKGSRFIIQLAPTAKD